MDRITQGLLTAFSESRSFSNLSVDRQFERFAAYVCIRRHYEESFDPDSVITGQGGDGGIDAIAVIVNGTLVTDIDELEDILSQTSQIDVSFIFVQATTSDNFSAQKIGNFGFGVLDFLKDDPDLVKTQPAKDAHQIMLELYRNAAKFRGKNPACRLFYVSTGRWQDDAALVSRRDSVKSDLEETNHFSAVTFECVDRTRLQELANRAQNSVSKSFTFRNKHVVPCSDDIKEAYLGFVPAKTIVDIITDEDGNIIKSIFYDNVRDYQGPNNKVNREIIKTLKSDARKRFALMNNGITIIARSLQPTGENVIIEDFQIVNGCQTCHSIFLQKEVAAENTVHVPLKLISTQDEDVIADIIYATNRQTQISDAQFIGGQKFPKDLERYFQTYPSGKAVYFERRACQYESSNIEKLRVITQKNMINAYASMFLNEPHSTTRNHRTLLGYIGEAIFAPDHVHISYYTAAFALYRVERLIRRKTARAVEKFHVLHAARMLFDSTQVPRPNSRDMERYCSRFLEVLWDEEKGEELLLKAVGVVSGVSGNNTSRDFIRSKSFTDKVTDECDAVLAAE